VKILISGSRGFIGSSVGQFAASAGHEVFGLGRASQAVDGWKGQYRQTDVATADLSVVIREFKPDVIVHAAGTASVSASITSPLDDFRAATLTWANMLEGIRRSELNPVVIFPSSAAVYGVVKELPIKESIRQQPISPYGFHKASCELLAQEYAQCFGLRIVVGRLFSVFGPSQKRLLVWELYRQAAGDEPVISLQGTGEESRDYLHVDDVSTALLALSTGNFEAANPQLVNIGSGEEIKVIDLARRIRDLIAPQKEVVARGEMRPGDPDHWRADISRLRSLVRDWSPGPFAERLESCVRAWRER
jgi:UDP-glucose 4-epimerase